MRNTLRTVTVDGRPGDPLFDPGTFDNRYVTVGGDILQFLHNPGRPANFHAICRFVGTQTEMSRSSAR